jgi:hypothetical protein
MKPQRVKQMPITKTEVTTCVCDRCGHESDNKDDKGRDPHEYGALTLTAKGTDAAMSFQGDWGGINLSFDLWLCMECRKSFQAWLSMGKDKRESQ